MGMLDGKPFVPRTGAPVYFRHRKYVLKWTAKYGRTLFGSGLGSTNGCPVYRLEPKHDCGCAQAPCPYHFDVYSLMTGKRLAHERIICYMVRVNENDPLPKRPWWHDNRSPFRRNDPWRADECSTTP